MTLIKCLLRQGLENARGFYDVTEFRLNNTVIPYSPVDSVRWQNVTFEKWSTISFTVFNSFEIHPEAGRGKQIKDIDRTYESAGTGGGRRHYYYEEDIASKKLILYSKNKFYQNERYELQYSRPTSDRIILSVLTQQRIRYMWCSTALSASIRCTRVASKQVVLLR